MFVNEASKIGYYAGQLTGRTTASTVLLATVREVLKTHNDSKDALMAVLTKFQEKMQKTPLEGLPSIEPTG